MLRSVLVILSGNAAAFLFSLLRNLLLARLLPVSDYGIASTFAMIMAVVEMASAFGLQQQIVQAKEGDDPRFQAALQGFQLLRGLLSGALLYLFAGALAAFLGIPEVAWAYQLLALVPVLNALVHFDIHRLSRHMVFGPMLVTGAVPVLISLLAVWPLMLWLGDWRVMLAATLLQAVLAVIASHLLAERSWSIRYDRAVYAGSLRFGWPLMANSVLLFLVFQGDKMIVGRELGMAALAIFAMGMTLTLSPTMVFGRSLQNLFLPKLAQAHDPETFRRLAHRVTEANLVCGALFVVGTVLLGGPVVNGLLGAKYAELLPLLPALAVMQAVRIAKGGPSAVAVARAQAENAFYANILRVMVLPLSWWLVVSGAGLSALILTALLGELAGFGVALWLLAARQKIALRPMVPVLLVWGAVLLLGLAAGVWPEVTGLRIAVMLGGLAALATGVDLLAPLARRRKKR